MRYKGPSCSFTIRVSPEEHSRLIENAHAEQVSLNKYLIFILTQEVMCSTDGFDHLFDGTAALENEARDEPR